MLTDSEVLATLSMLRSEHLDVRTVTMGISLFDCAAPDFDTFAYKVRSKILRNAEKLVETCDIVGDRYGIPVVNKRISVSPMATVCAGFTRDQMVEACRVLDDCAKDVGVDFIGGFGALVEKGMTPGERNLIDALPEALATTDRICSSINVGSTKAGINMDAVKLMGERILDVAAATAARDAIGCAKLVVFCNIPQDVPFMAGAYLGVGEPDVVINVGVSGPGVVKKALDRAFEAKGDYLTITDAAEVIKHTAYKVTRVGEIIGNEVAQRLNLPFGVADLSLAPTPAVGDSVGEIFQTMGLSSIGAPGTTAILAMLNDAVKKGGVFASSHVGGLSGAFIPVSEDSAIEAAHIAVMDDRISSIATLVRLSRITHGVLVENIAFAIGVKIIFALLALTGNATMWMAVFADTGTCLIVVANAMRMLRMKPRLDRMAEEARRAA